MSKHSVDNRANQLNPNNDAYYSSRGGARQDDDDDFAPAPRRAFAQDPIQVALARCFQEYKRPSTEQREKFEFDFVSFGGQIALLEFSAVLPEKIHGYTDCEDIAEHVFRKVNVMLASLFETPVAFSQIRRSGHSSRLICNAGYEYSPSLTSTLASAREIARKKMWFSTGKAAVEKLQLKLQNRETMPREDLGPISPATLRRDFWKV